MKNKSYKKQIMMIALLALFVLAGNVHALTISFVHAGATDDPRTKKTITWMTESVASPKAVMQLATKAAGTAAYQNYNGKTKAITYNSAYLGTGAPGADINKIAYQVTVTGLKENTTYIYRVGDGTTWSKQMEFTTAPAVGTNKFTFYALGDVQAYSSTTTSFVAGGTKMLRDVANLVPSVKPLFIAQVGDVVDREHVYNYYKLFGDVCDSYSAFASTDMHLALGNHEYYRGINTVNFTGTGRGDIAKFLFGTPAVNSGNTGSGTYAADYGNLRIYTLDFIGRDGEGNPAAKIDAIAAWLKADLAKCNKTWKIVNVHYPIYHGTDPTPFSYAVSTWRPIFADYGVQIVFGGHYHSIARMQVNKAGTVVARGLSTANNTIQSSAGTIHMTAGNTCDFTDASVYIRCDVDNDKMVVTTTRHNGVIVDKFTLQTTAITPPPVVTEKLTLNLSSSSTANTAIGNTQTPDKTVYLYIKETTGGANVNRQDCDLTSSNTDIATISAYGTITINKMNGSTTIRAVRKSDKIEGTLTLTVSGAPDNPPTPLTLGFSSIPNNDPYIPVAASVDVGKKIYLTIKETNTGSYISRASCTLTSSNTDVATISVSGEVTGIANGTTIIKAVRDAGGVGEATITLTVTGGAPPVVAVTGVTVAPTTLSLVKGGTSTLTATVSPSNATNKNVTWSSNASSIASVDNAGKVTAVAAGNATITVTTADGGKTATCAVTVTEATVAVDGVSVNPTTLSLNVGGTSTLTATVSPSNATNKNVTWSSSAESIASVDNTGKVTAKAVGSATITVTTVDGGKKATCAVTVSNVGAPFTSNEQLELIIVARTADSKQAVTDPKLTVLTPNTAASVTGSGCLFINDIQSGKPVTRSTTTTAEPPTSYSIYPAGMATVSDFGGITTFGECVLWIKATNNGREGLISIPVGSGVGIVAPKQSGTNVYTTKTGIAVQLDRDATVELYTVNGILIDKVHATKFYTRDLAKGVYIIKLNGQAIKFVK